jgi:hypothetical protein
MASTQIGQMVRAIVNQRPSEFADTFSSIFKSRISDDVATVQNDLKANMFKQGSHTVDFDTVTGRKEPTNTDTPPTADETQIVDHQGRNDGVMDAFLGGLNKSLEDMYKLDQTRSMADGDGDGSYSDGDTGR